jgi:lysophospholipase L1-like esterase
MFYNRGISGNRVRDLDARWQQDTLDLKPDELSILIGVNDVLSIIKNTNPDTMQTFEETYKRILDKTKDALPNTLVVLCEPFILPLGWVNEKTEIWQTEILKRVFWQAIIFEIGSV